MKKKYKNPLYFLIAAGILMLLGGLLTYPTKPPSSNNKQVSTNKQRLERVVSPPGLARFIRIESVDKKFREEGEFTISLELPNTEAVKTYLSKISLAIDNFKLTEEKKMGRELKMAKLPWRVIPVNNTDGKPERLTGETAHNDEIYLVKYREFGSFKDKGKQINTQIIQFGLDGKPYKGAITPNSKIKVSADIILFNNIYGVGASLRLKAVQLVELSDKGTQLIPEDFGFISETWEADLKQASPKNKDLEEEKLIDNNKAVQPPLKKELDDL